jgi:hypothetical protein
MNKTTKDDITWDLDQLSMPAWHLLPNEDIGQLAVLIGGI